MKRRLLILLCAVSLVLCVATVALWIRSRHTTDAIGYGRSITHRNWLITHSGGIEFLAADGRMEPWYVPIAWRPETPLRRWCLLSYGSSPALASGLSLPIGSLSPMTPTAPASIAHYPSQTAGTTIGADGFSFSMSPTRAHAANPFRLLTPTTQTANFELSLGKPLPANTFYGKSEGSLNLGGPSLTPMAVSPTASFQYVGTLVLSFTGWPRPSHYLLGFGFDDVMPRATMRIVVPFWFLVIVFSVLPAMAAMRMTRARARRGRQLCVHCGYDLRATPERCPECGTAVKSAG
jgi:hypothetical protein